MTVWPRRSSALPVISLVLVLLAACAGAGAPAARQPLQFGYSLWPGDLPARLAQERGYYVDEKVAVDLTLYDSYDAAMLDLLGGRYDGITLSLGDVVNLSQQTSNARVVLFLDMSAGGDAVVAAPGIGGVADLRGQRVGVSFGTFGELLIEKMLAAHGLTTRDVTLINVDPLEAPAALQRGEVQAVHTWEPMVTQAVQAGAHKIFTSSETPGLIPDVAVFRADTLAQRPDEVRAFLRAWLRAVDDWLARPAAAADSLSRALNVPADEISLDGIRLLNRDANLAMFTPGDTTQSGYFTAGTYIDFFIRKGAITRRPEVDQILDPSYLK